MVKRLDLLDLALAFMVLFFAPMFLSACLFFVRVPVGGYAAGLGLLLALGYLGAVRRNGPAVLIVLAATAAALGISNAVLDLSWDGLGYHQPAIDDLRHGLNPVYERFTRIYNEHYPKATWYFGATVYHALHDIQFAKVYQFVLLFAALCYGQHVFRRQSLPVRLLAALACLNPVALCQLFTFYVDGALASLSAICVFYAWRQFTAGADDADGPGSAEHALLLMALISLTNLKFTGLVYSLIVLGFLWLWLWRRRSFRAARRFALALAVPALCGMLVVGYSPYVTNLLQGKHIFHPLAGPEKEDILSYHSPKGFTNMDRFRKLALGLAARSGHYNFKRAVELKPPFFVTAEEWAAYESPDLRIGGFGPLFSGILLVALLVAIRYPAGLSWWTIALLLGLTLVNPESWWARYVPFFWLLPFFLQMGRRVPSWIRYVLFGIMLINVCGLAWVNATGAVRDSADVGNKLGALTGQLCCVPEHYFYFKPTLDRFGVIELADERLFDETFAACQQLHHDASICCMVK